MRAFLATWISRLFLDRSLTLSVLSKSGAEKVTWIEKEEFDRIFSIIRPSEDFEEAQSFFTGSQNIQWHFKEVEDGNDFIEKLKSFNMESPS